MSPSVTDRYPFGEDTKAYLEILYKYVGAYVNVYYADDEAILADRDLSEFWNDLGVKDRSKIPELSGKRMLVGGLSMFILYVTGLHNHVGNVADYLVDPTFASPKIRPGSELADVQARFLLSGYRSILLLLHVRSLTFLCSLCYHV